MVNVAVWSRSTQFYEVRYVQALDREHVSGGGGVGGALRQVAPGAEPARPKQPDLSYIGADVYGVIVFHPQRMARSPEVAALLKNQNVAAALKPGGLDLLRIEEIVGQAPVPQKEPMPADYWSPIGPRQVVRFSRPVDIETEAKRMLGKPRSPDAKIVTLTMAGKKCYRFESVVKEPAKTEEAGEPVRRKPWLVEVDSTITCVADDRTVLMSLRGEADLRKMLAAGKAQGPFVERLHRLDARDDVVLAIALEPMHGSIKERLAHEKRSSPTSPRIPFNENGVAPSERHNHGKRH